MKLNILKSIFGCMGMSAFLLTGCVVSDGDEPCSSGDYRCTETDMLQLCVEKNWEDYTDCKAIERTCALVSGLSQCIPTSGSTDNIDTGSDSGKTDSSESTDDTQTPASDSDTPSDTTTTVDTETNGTDDTGSDTNTATDTGTTADSDTGTGTEPDTNPSACQSQVRIGILGSMQSTASGANISSFVDWLNAHSDAQVSAIAQRTTLDAAFLANYDVLLLLLQADSPNDGWWSYTPEEVAALTTWVNAGGGVIATAGYTPSTDNETGAINSLLAESAGLTYDAASDTFTTCTAVQCTCWQSAVPIDNWDASHPIAKDVIQIGALHGFKINTGNGASIIATDENGDPAIAAVASGLGKIVAIGDEWPLFANMWQAPGTTATDTATDTESAAEPDTYSPCYDTESGSMITVANSFQHPQFWYNVINWVAPQGSCMTLQDTTINP